MPSTTLHSIVRSGFILLDSDLRQPAQWGEDDLPVFYSTLQEAEAEVAEVADDMMEFYRQVKEGQRQLDEIPLPDFVEPAALYSNGMILAGEEGFHFRWTAEELRSMR
jgi:hypothetical protein